MKKFWALPVMLVLAASLTFAENANAAKKHYFDSLTGKWRGKGFITAGVGAKEEAVRCRLVNRKDSKIPKLILSGNCGIGGVLIPMAGWIQQIGNSKKYTASLFRSLGFLRVDKFSGSLRGKKLNLKFVGRDKISKEDITVFVTISGNRKDRFDIVLSGTDPKSKKRYKIGTINFSRN